MIESQKIGPHTLYRGDCMEVMRKLGRFDACVTDPPYGIGEAAGKNKSRGNKAAAKDYGELKWDNEPCSKQQIAKMRKVSDWQIIFGGNYFHLPPSQCWLVWDKLNGSNDFADCELAWTNLPKAIRRLVFQWNGMLRQNKEPRGDHPTQKPVGVMLWCLKQLPQDVKTIIDPFMGSGTTGVACQQMGLVFTGIERERQYFDSACKRLEKAMQETAMFDRIEAKAKPLFEVA